MKGKDVHQIVVKRKDIFGIIVGIHLLIWILNLPFSQLQMLLLGRRAITLYQLGMLECLLDVYKRQQLPYALYRLSAE